MRPVFFIPACLLALSSLHAQYFSTVTYTSLDGLPTSELHSVLVDSKGYVWTTSSVGISRFDGQQFRNFSVEDGLASNQSLFLEEDGHGNIWVFHNESQGETKFSIIRENAIRVIPFTQKYGGDQASLQYNPHTGEIWVLTWPPMQLFVYDESRDTFLLRPIPAASSFDSGLLLVDKFRDRAMYVKHQSYPSEAYFIENGKSSKLPDLPFAPGGSLDFSFLPDGKLLCVDRSGKGFTFEEQKGWMTLQAGRQAITATPQPPARVQLLVKETGHPSVYELVEYSREFPDGLHFRYYSTAAVNPAFYKADKAPDGTYWIATREGLIHLFPAFLDFLVREENWFMGDLHAICEDRKGQIWFGSYSKGLSFFDGEKVYRAEGNLRPFQRILPGSVRDAKGNMLFWLEEDAKQTEGGLLVIENEQQGRIAISDELGYYLARSFDGQLAFGMDENSLALQDPQHEEPRFGKIIGPEKGLQIQNVITAVKDWQGRWWMGRPSSGIAFYDPVQDTVYNYLRKDPSRDYGVMSSELDAKGNLWFGTTHGLCFFAPPGLIDPANFDPAAAFQQIGLDVMGSSQVNVLKLLDENTLLAGNYQGLALIDLKQFYETGKPRIYFLKKEDGFSGLGVEQNAVWLDSNGYVWVASDAGAHRFNPRLVRRPDRLPIFSIDSLRVGERSYPVTPGKPVRLKSQARFQTLTVHLNAEYDPIRPNHVFFAYKFKNDTAFSAPVQNEVINFPNLAPGRYILQVKLLKDGSESEIQELQIVIPRPLLATPWTYVLIMSLLGTGAWAVQRNSNRQKMEKNKLQVQAIVNQLNPHFINNALQWVQIRVYKDDDAVGVISKLGENIRLVFKNSREKMAFHSLEEEMKLVENYLFIQKKRFTSHLDYELPDEAQVKALGQVMVPLMQIQIHCENAVEHGIRNKEEKGYVKVVLNDEGEYLHIVVEDSGVGRRRAGEIGSKGTQQGTIMLENLKDIFNSRNPLPIEYRYEDDIFTDVLGEGYGTRVHIRIPKKYRYEFD